MKRRDFLVVCGLLGLNMSGCITAKDTYRPIQVDFPEEGSELEKRVVEPETKKVEEKKDIEAEEKTFNPDDPQKIVVNIPSYNIRLYQGDFLRLELDCRVGKRTSPTPIGKGKIIKKRESVIFRYLSGTRKGQVIKYSYLDPEKRTIPMPYDKMRGLDFDTNGVMTGPVIHSTTDYWTVGTARSHGCIGLRIDDMLKLYDMITDKPLPEMETTYQTMFYDPSTQEVTFWCDIYNKSTNNIQSLVQLIGEHEIFFGQDDKQAIERNIAKIDGELREANPYIQKIIDQGKDPKDEIYRLNRTIPTSELV